jgi:Endonuclease/Exonuclease/phosphatase family
MSATADRAPATPGTGDGARGSAPLVAFTWNLRGSTDALALACRYLATLGSFVAALQELPDDAETALSIAVGEHKLKLLSRGMLRWNKKDETAMVAPKVALLASDGVDVDPIGNRHEYKPQLDDRRRLEGVTLRSEVWQNLQVLGVHAWDPISRHQIEERQAWAGIMSEVVRDFWLGGPLIVMGDLNANPWSPEVTNRTGLYALRRKDWPERGSGKLPGTDKHATPLYNPMWQLLADDAQGGHGTIFYPGSDLRWSCFDQIIVSDHLREHIGPPSVLRRLCDRDLVDDRGAPKKRGGEAELSDHLPVQVTVDLGEVTSCRISATS